jgi:hypothetical protein
MGRTGTPGVRFVEGSRELLHNSWGPPESPEQQAVPTAPQSESCPLGTFSEAGEPQRHSGILGREQESVSSNWATQTVTWACFLVTTRPWTVPFCTEAQISCV